MQAIYCYDQQKTAVVLQLDSASGMLQFRVSGQTKTWAAHLIHKRLRKSEEKYILEYHQGQEGSLLLNSTVAKMLVSELRSYGIYREGTSKGNTRALKVLLLIFIPLIALPLLLYFVGIDWMSRQAAYKIPIEKEIEIGKTIYEQTIRNYPSIDHRRSELVDSFYQALGYQSGFPVKITVINSSEVNAFALPGGNICIMSGLLDRLDAAGPLAALLSHELSHINGRHAARGFLRNAGAYMLISSLLGDADLMNMTENLKSLSYSRAMEEEADEQGFLQMERSGQFHPGGMVALFKVLEQGGSAAPPQFLSTHPDTEVRRTRAEKALKNVHWHPKDSSASLALFKKIKP